ncbi:flagellar biosynthesis protein FlhA [Miltoncostaea oceani]|jgi:flagellar biosynthesis protein FlhA|uniref:flagellar biosynthesis protein FlhA n=1 Tax=Miltoncostaea oceani TaxID=2843216 RepID=UPI001C3DEEAA|nr:flagellar biosynthesis protein FlhA [Miltoncostaea oceani]
MSTAVATTAPRRAGVLDTMLKNSDVAIAVVVVGIVVMMIIPLPTWLLDILLTANISAALAIVLATLYTTEPLQFSVFPSLLLVATLFRLGLNISGTRLILLHGEAGEVISAFGSFVVGGNVVVGLIVFTILVVIQFVVITNGAGRVAEVAARFTLDAMPGKQMAIDADLNAGVITDEEAKERRETIAKEADFYGAMDGASKFVKGDAIAAVLIVMINLVGGLSVGVFQQGMGFSEAIQHFSLLTVGEGLVSQIPALLISVATGIIVTRSVGDGNLGHDLTQQLVRQPRALMLAGGVAMGMGLVPGLPKLPFFIIGGLVIGLALMLRRGLAEEEAVKAADEATAVATRPSEPENVAALLPLDPLELEIGYGLVPLVDADEGGDLLGRVAMVRRQMATELGLSLAPIRIRDNIQLGSHDYAVKIRGVEVARWSLMPGQLLAMNPGTADLPLDGIPTVEPSFGLPAVWIGEAQREQAEISGYTVVDPTSLVVTHLSEVIRRNAAELLGRQDVRALLDALKERMPAPVEELVPDLMTVGEVQRVLQTLLAESVPVRDMVTILETLGDKAKLTKDVPILAEYCRQALSRAICGRFVDETGTLRAITLDPEADREIAESVARTDDGTAVTMDPARAAALIDTLKEQVDHAQAVGAAPVVLCSGATRRHLKALTVHAIPTLTVLSYHEILPSVRIEPVGLAALV